MHVLPQADTQSDTLPYARAEPEQLNGVIPSDYSYSIPAGKQINTVIGMPEIPEGHMAVIIYKTGDGVLGFCNPVPPDSFDAHSLRNPGRVCVRTKTDFTEAF